MNRLLIFVFLTLIAANGASLAADRLKLDDTSIIGTRELPKVLYIVPWKNSRLGELSTSAEKGTFEGGMVPIDRNTYQREVEYFGMLGSDASGIGKGAAQGASAVGAGSGGSAR